MILGQNNRNNRKKVAEMDGMTWKKQFSVFAEVKERKETS